MLGLYGVRIDASDASVLARFYADLLGMELPAQQTTRVRRTHREGEHQVEQNQRLDLGNYVVVNN